MAQEKGFSAEQCLSIAAQASAIAVSRKGASVSIPVWAELQTIARHVPVQRKNSEGISLPLR